MSGSSELCGQDAHSVGIDDWKRFEEICILGYASLLEIHKKTKIWPMLFFSLAAGCVHDEVYSR